jgi:hypothetical protein
MSHLPFSLCLQPKMEHRWLVPYLSVGKPSHRGHGRAVAYSSAIRVDGISAPILVAVAVKANRDLVIEALAARPALWTTTSWPVAPVSIHDRR